MNRVVLLFLIGFVCSSYSQDPEITTLQPGVRQSHTVSLDRWVYYNFTAPTNQGWLLRVVHSKSHDVDVYVRKNELPTRMVYDYKDTNSDPNIKIEGTANPNATTYFVGVFGFKGSITVFSIELEITNGCPSGCNGNGVCVSGTCYCNSGFIGVACETRYTTINQDQIYSGSVNTSAWNYYSISVYSANNIIVYVNQTEGDVDLYVRYLTIPSLNSWNYADNSKARGIYMFNISIAEPELGIWYLGFYGHSKASYSFKVTEVRVCPMLCSKHGRCVGSHCSCSADYTGLSCEEKRDSLTLNSTVSGYVGENYWNWYRFDSNSNTPFAVTVKHDSGANCDIYIDYNQKPTTTRYLYKNDSTLSETEIVVFDPYWFLWNIGIYGSTVCDYTLTITQRSRCYCVHGECSVSGRCICRPGYSGEFCELQTNNLTVGVVSSSHIISNSQWIYFSIEVKNSSQLIIVAKETETQGMVWFYVAAERYPTLYDYDISDTSSKSSTHRINMEFNAPVTHTYFVGAYGSPIVLDQIVSFGIEAWYAPF